MKERGYLFWFAALAVLLFVPALAGAQTAPQTASPTLSLDPNEDVRFEASGGYQWLHAPDQVFPFGLNIDGAWNRTPMLGLVGELGFAIGSEDDDEFNDVDLAAWNIGVGPRVNYRANPRYWPYAQILIGALHARVSGDVDDIEVSDSATRFMLQPGAGVNVNVGDGWGVVGSADYRRVFLDEEEDGESGENEFRLFVGIRLLLD